MKTFRREVGKKVCQSCSVALIFYTKLYRKLAVSQTMFFVPSRELISSSRIDLKHKTVVQPSALREEARRTNLPLLAIGCHADCLGERRTSPFSGIERSLSRAVVIKTKSLPISATTFPTALSLYIAHDGRKHKHNPTLSANKHVVQICRSSLSAATDGLADGSGERRTSPVNCI